jgi:predicted transcriptional regulator
MSQLKHKLDRKEYILQYQERKIYNYEKYMQRKSLTDPEALKLLLKYNENEEKLDVLHPNLTLSNVVDDNLNLRTELKSAVAEINRL